MQTLLQYRYRHAQRVVHYKPIRSVLVLGYVTLSCGSYEMRSSYHCPDCPSCLVAIALRRSTLDSRLVSALDTRKSVKLLLLFLYIAGVPVPARGQETSRPLKYAITKQCQEKCGLTHGNLMELSLDTLPRNGGGRDLVHIGP